MSREPHAAPPTASSPTHDDHAGSPTTNPHSGEGKSLPLSVLDSLDAFAFQPAPRTTRRVHSTVLGKIGSLALYAIVIIFIVQSSISFFRDPPASSLQKDLDPNVTVAFPPFAVSFPHLGLPTTAFVVASRVQLLEDGGITFQSMTVETGDKCTASTGVFYHPLFYQGNDLRRMCILETPTLYGNCHLGSCSLIVVNLVGCVNASLGCQFVPELFSNLGALPVTFTFNVTTAGVVTPEVADFRASNAVVTLQRVYFQRYKTVVLPDFLRRFTSDAVTDVRRTQFVSSARYLLGDTLLSDDVKKTGYAGLMEVQMLLDRDHYVETKVPQTLPVLLGSWSAFFSVVVTVFGVILFVLTKRDFYNKHPHWDEINCKRVAPAVPLEVVDAASHHPDATATGDVAEGGGGVAVVPVPSSSNGYGETTAPQLYSLPQGTSWTIETRPEIVGKLPSHSPHRRRRGQESVSFYYSREWEVHFDPVSGFYYDATINHWCDPMSQKWLTSEEFDGIVSGR